MIEIKKINYIETFHVRHPVLRAGKPIETCFFINDEAKTTTHFGAFDNDKIIGVVSVFLNNNTTFEHEFQFQLRGMAVLQSYQKQGVGVFLLTVAEQYILDKKATLMWFNAREIAVNFYKKMGYSIASKPFFIEEIGAHFLMYKEI